MSKLQERGRIPPPQNHGEKRRQFNGVRMRKWGKWVSEVRIPNSRAKIWLGSYDTAEQAARAFDAAIYCLRGPNATKFNFPDALPAIPSASSLSRRQIQLAAAKYARGQIPSTWKTNDGALAAKPSTPPIASMLSEMETLTDSLLMSEALDFMLAESLLSDGNQVLNLDQLLSEDALTSELMSPMGSRGVRSCGNSEFWADLKEEAKINL